MIDVQGHGVKPKDTLTQRLGGLVNRRTADGARATVPPAEDMPRLLIVGGDRLRERLAPALAAAGYTLTLRREAIGTAVEIMSRKPDLVLVEDDPELPGLSGRGLARSIATTHPGLVVLLVTVDADLESRRKLERELSVFVLWLGDRDLVGALEHALRTHRSRPAR